MKRLSLRVFLVAATVVILFAAWKMRHDILSFPSDEVVVHLFEPAPGWPEFDDISIDGCILRFRKHYHSSCVEGSARRRLEQVFDFSEISGIDIINVTAGESLITMEFDEKTSDKLQKAREIMWNGSLRPEEAFDNAKDFLFRSVSSGIFVHYCSGEVHFEIGIGDFMTRAIRSENEDTVSRWILSRIEMCQLRRN